MILNGLANRDDLVQDHQAVLGGGRHWAASGAEGNNMGEDQCLDEFVSSVLSASWLLVGISSQSLESVDGEVTIAQFRTLAVLAQLEQSNLSRLAGDLAVNVSTAMRMIDRLVAAGFVSRAENPKTRREVVLCLTPEGQKLVSEVLARRRAEIARVLAVMPEASREALSSGLASFTEIASSIGVRPIAPNALGW
jgi:DNA-binding MarR family transcriptional regulator